MKKHAVVAVPVWEYERGWGSKVDDHMICLTSEDATKFVKEFNSKNTEESAPDWYMKASSNFSSVDITDEQLKKVKKIKEKRIWLSSLKDKN